MEEWVVTKPLEPLLTEADYQAVLKEYEAFFDNEPQLGSEEGEYFQHLGAALARYEFLNEAGASAEV
ncbi:MAG: hypothetical protein C0461_13760 [Brevundimonas sp.]|nr:hypothetical protein [Brevundimonas sp.]